MSLFISEAKLVRCPFDRNHKVSESRYMFHVKKCCSENRKHFTQCKYNNAHWVRSEELELHWRSCPDFLRKVQELKDKYQKPPPNNTCAQPPPKAPAPTLEPKSKTSSTQADSLSKVNPEFSLLAPINWNKLHNMETFEPLTKFQIQTLTKGERKKYHLLLTDWTQNWKNKQDCKNSSKS